VRDQVVCGTFKTGSCNSVLEIHIEEQKKKRYLKPCSWIGHYQGENREETKNWKQTLKLD
jgi:hypothetical protein